MSVRGLVLDCHFASGADDELATPYTPEPDGAASRGLYVDQVYF